MIRYATGELLRLAGHVLAEGLSLGFDALELGRTLRNPLRSREAAQEPQESPCVWQVPKDHSACEADTWPPVWFRDGEGVWHLADMAWPTKARKVCTHAVERVVAFQSPFHLIPQGNGLCGECLRKRPQGWPLPEVARTQSPLNKQAVDVIDSRYTHRQP